MVGFMEPVGTGCQSAIAPRKTNKNAIKKIKILLIILTIIFVYSFGLSNINTFQMPLNLLEIKNFCIPFGYVPLIGQAPPPFLKTKTFHIPLGLLKIKTLHNGRLKTQDIFFNIRYKFKKPPLYDGVILNCDDYKQGEVGENEEDEDVY